MVMADTTTAGAGLEGGSSADAAELQSDAGQAEPDLLEQLRSALREDMRAELSHIDRRQQSSSDRQQNQIAELGQRIEALSQGGQGATLAEIRDLVDDLHQLTIEPDVREKRALDRKLARFEKAAAEPPKPQEQQRTPPAADDLDARYDAEIAPDLEDYARLKGFTAAELAAGNWMDRVMAAGAPQGLTMTPAGIRAYKDGVKAALDRMAKDGAAARRPQTRPANLGSGGGAGGGGTWQQAQRIKSVGELSDEAYERLVAGK